MKLRQILLSVAVVAGSFLASPPAVLAQALPDALRSAGVTVSEWNALQVEVARVAEERGASEAALRAVALRLSQNLMRDGRVNINEVLMLIDERGQQLAELQQRLTLLERAEDSQIAALLAQAQAAIIAGRLSDADALLARAAESDLAAARLAEAQAAMHLTRAAETRAEQGRLAYIQADYLGAASLYGQALEIAPESDANNRWRYAMEQAGALRDRGATFAEPVQLRAAIQLYQTAVLPLAPRETRPDAWADTRNDLALTFFRLGQLNDTASLREAARIFAELSSVYSREQSPVRWAHARKNLGFALMGLGTRTDDVEALRAAIRPTLDSVDVYIEQGLARETQRASLNAAMLMFSLGARQADPRLLAGAVDSAERTLTYVTIESDRDTWGQAQSILCGAAQLLAARDIDGPWADKAVLACAAASGAVDPIREPFKKTQLEMLLGGSEAIRGERRHDVSELRRSVARLRAVAASLSAQDAPVPWATAKAALGAALASLANESQDVAVAREAVQVSQDAARVLDPTAHRAMWVSTRLTEGYALSLQAQQTPAAATRLALLNRALEICDTLEPLLRNTDAIRLGMVQYHRSGVLIQRGQLSASMDDLRRAQIDLDAAAAVATQADSAYYLERVRLRRVELAAARGNQSP